MDTQPRAEDTQRGAGRTECTICHRTFRDNYNLKRHQARATTCAPIVDTVGKDNACRYCGKVFASRPSMNRHIRQYCKIANSEEGMEKLMEHTIQRQLAAVQAQNAEMKTQMAELAALLKGQLTMTPAGGIPAGGQDPTPLATNTATLATQVAGSAVVNNGPASWQVTNTQNVQNIAVQQNTTIVINPWDGERRIEVSMAQMMAALAENPRLREFARWPVHELTDVEKAPPYVAELFMDLVKRGHADPASRNVYLNPRRADQALVHLKCGRWEVLPMAEASRLMFDGVAQSIHRVIMSYEERRQLPVEAQNVLSLAEMMYWDEPDEYVKRAKGAMSAHLTNTAPSQAPSQAPAGPRVLGSGS